MVFDLVASAVGRGTLMVAGDWRLLVTTQKPVSQQFMRDAWFVSHLGAMFVLVTL